MTEQEIDQIAEMWANGLKVREIAERMGYSESIVSQKIYHDRDRFPRRNKKVPKDVRHTWALMVATGSVTADEAARETGAHVNAVRYWVKKLGKKGIGDVEYRRPTCHGCFIECEAVRNIVDDVWEFPCSASMIEWASRNRYHRPGEMVYEGSGSL